MYSPAVAAACGRTAPSGSGPAHLGTLLSALLAYLDARSRGGRIILRLEDLDRERCSPHFGRSIHEDLLWLGLSFDAVVWQSTASAQHAAALDQLADLGVLYACACSRQQLAAVHLQGRHRCSQYLAAARGQAHSWQQTQLPLRLTWRALPEAPNDLAAASNSFPPDPVLRRRDGSIAYHLAGVVDDAAAQVTTVVRGRDLLPSLPLHLALQALLGLPQPTYAHHLLLLQAAPTACAEVGAGASSAPGSGTSDDASKKLSKAHGAASLQRLNAQLRRPLSPQALCGLLAHWAGLRSTATPLGVRTLLDGFEGFDTQRANQIIGLQHGALTAADAPAGAPW
jgi:glutamyl-Q tRNA(Asp) synthetase